MSVCHCLHHALDIAKGPRERFRERVDALPTQCTHADCGEPRNCRERNERFLSMLVWRQEDSELAKAAAQGNADA